MTSGAAAKLTAPDLPTMLSIIKAVEVFICGRRGNAEGVMSVTEETRAAGIWIGVMAERIVAQFAPLRVILFGSHARGDATRDSDIDLLVVLPHVDDRRATTVAIRRALADLPVAKDIIVTTPDEIEQRGDLVGTVLRPALREGRVLYERA